MKVYYSPYKLTPLKAANRLSSLRPETGVLLKGVLGNKVTFCDYFPHVSLGDRSVDEFLDGLKFQNHTYDKKCFDLLLRDHELYWMKPRRIKNHKLWNVGEELAPIIKYKVKAQDDFGFLRALKNKIPTRLDANGLFSRTEFTKFMKEIPEDLVKYIEYFEDPLHESDWSQLPLKTAKDFIEAAPFDYIIYKPNAEFHPETELPVIFSTYLGHNLGRWHAYCELLKEGNLDLVHGIQTEGFYREEKNLFDGNYVEGFSANIRTIHKMYKEISELGWKNLCSM